MSFVTKAHLCLICHGKSVAILQKNDPVCGLFQLTFQKIPNLFLALKNVVEGKSNVHVKKYAFVNAFSSHLFFAN